MYVQAFPGGDGRERISTNGGGQVRWRADGKELFYVALDGQLMAVPTSLASERQHVAVGTPVPLFATRIEPMPLMGPQGTSCLPMGSGF